MPLTPDDVQDVRFDHAPLGKRGYHEDEVDDFLDQVEQALRGEIRMTSQAVREIEFEQGGIVRRGYDEKQVDEFLEAVVVQLEGGEPDYVVNRGRRPSEHGIGRTNGHGTVDIIQALESVETAQTVEIAPNGHGHNGSNGAGQHSGGRIIGTLHEAITESANGYHNGHPAPPRQADPVPVLRTETKPRPQPQPKPQPEPDPNSVPLPPAVPGMHGYRQRDVQRMAECVRAAVRSPHGPTSEDIARMRLERVADGEKGYDPFLVEALRDAWVAELRRQGR